MNVLFDGAVRHTAGYRDVDPSAVHAALGSVRIIDVREPHELVGELGHIAGAELVPLATLEAASRNWDKDREIVIVCRSGGRSARAAAFLAAMRFEHVMNMAGGMLAWNAAMLPVSRATTS